MRRLRDLEVVEPTETIQTRIHCLRVWALPFELKQAAVIIDSLSFKFQPDSVQFVRNTLLGGLTAAIVLISAARDVQASCSL